MDSSKDVPTYDRMLSYGLKGYKGRHNFLNNQFKKVIQLKQYWFSRENQKLHSFWHMLKKRDPVHQCVSQFTELCFFKLLISISNYKHTSKSKGDDDILDITNYP